MSATPDTLRSTVVSGSTADRPRPSSWRRRAAWVAGIYGVLAGAWISLSDRALATLIHDPQWLLQVGTYKGLGFVVITSLLLFVLTLRAFRSIELRSHALRQKDLQLRASQEQLAQVVHHAGEAIVSTDPAGRIVHFNTAAAALFDQTESAALGRPVDDFIPGVTDCRDGSNLRLTGRRASGAEIPLEGSVSRLHSRDGSLVTVIARDITQRLSHEIELERLTRLYSALSHVNQAIVWAKSREVLLPKICQILVDQGGFRMAWIGWKVADQPQVIPVAHAGSDSDYVNRLRIYTDDRPEGRGPSGTAFRENRPYICNAFFQDPQTQPWREEARRFGIQASAVFPIRARGEVVGLLNVYAGSENFFQDKEISLLAEAAADISFALENLDRDAQRLAAETMAVTERTFSEAMLESMPGILYLYGEDGRFLRWNNTFEKVTKRTGAELASMHPLDFFSPEERPLLASRIQEVFTRGESAVEASLVAADGQSMPYFFTGRRIEFAGERCLVGIGIDISDRKAAEAALAESERRFRTTLDCVLEACQLIGFDWTYLYLNEEAAIQNRRPNAELLGRRFTEAWPGIEATEVYRLLQRTMHERVHVQAEVDFLFPDQTRGWFDMRAQPAPEGILLLSVNITERKRAETLLREANESLERKVAERTAELHEALTRAEAADRIKSAFLATMSHELRTPLNSIIGFTGILLQQLAGPLNPEQVKQLGMVRSSARHLLELINDVLDLSKIEAGQLEVRIEPFDLSATLERVIGLVRPLAEKKGLALIAPPPGHFGPLRGDRRRVEQILLNLINNAIKFTAEGSVTVTAERGEEPASEPGAAARPSALIRIIDTGIGIAPDDLKTLFQPFRQIDSGLSRHHEGTGLGLAICRRLADLLGGRITVQSEVARGSVFTLILPLHEP